MIYFGCSGWAIAGSGSAAPNFLKVAVDELLTYRIQEKIIDYIEAER
jgi:hypothetical protein